MTSPKSSFLTASRLRILLAVGLLLVIISGVAIFGFFYQHLNTYAGEVSKVSFEAESSDESLRQLQQLERELENYQPSIKRASEIVAERESYHYQDQVVRDLQQYAGRHGVVISSYDFTQAAAAPSAKPSAPQITNASTTLVTVTLKNPLDAAAFMRFVHDIENNLTKMQLTRLDLSRGSTATQPGSITSNTFEIEVYIK